MAYKMEFTQEWNCQEAGFSPQGWCVSQRELQRGGMKKNRT